MNLCLRYPIRGMSWDGKSLTEFHPGFLEMAKEEGIFGGEFMDEVSGSASVQEIDAIT